MANPGIGNKYASMNLNKSYGHVANPGQSNSGGYRVGRGRGGGGGMVVLSRPRSAHKVAPKLSVPPPLNLPSRRKEHEKFETLGTGSGAGGGAGSGARPSSSGMGWSKPSVFVVGERNEVGVGSPQLSGVGVQASDVVSRGGVISNAYVPPSAKRAVVGADVSVASQVEKVSVSRVDDFPSLRATLTAANGQAHNQKDSSKQKKKHGISEENSVGSREASQANSQVSVRPLAQSSQNSVDNVSGGEGQNRGNYCPQEQSRKHDDYFPGPLPLVRLNPRSDWADDERDTSHGLSSGRDHGYSRTEAYWERDFDFPRSGFIPPKPAQYQFDRRGQRDDDVGKGLSNEVSNADPFVRDGRPSSRDGRKGHPWRSNGANDGFGYQDVVNNRNNLGARPININLDMNKGNNYNHQFGGTTRNEHVNNGGFAASDVRSGRRDQGYQHNGSQHWNNSADINNGRGVDRNFEQNRYRDTPVRNITGARPSFSASYHSPNFNGDKRSFSKSETPYVEDPFLSSTTFDGKDSFSGGILGVVKRKKDANIMLDFHDPVRESFEAELERVQQLQEQERLRAIEEQERAMEMACREEEERVRVIREKEEQQRKMEEEAREAAWREEQEKMEIIRKAEELKVAREEEKQRMMLEEERRKQAAKQKLLELEERIARRRAESSKGDSSSATSGDVMTGSVKERDLSRPDDFASWEDGERMVERITNSASSDSSLSRPFDLRPRGVSDRDGSFAFNDRGKSFNSWRRDMFDSGNNSSFFSVDHDNGHLSPGREAASGGRSFPRKDLYGGHGYMPNSGGAYRGGVPEPHMGDFPHARGHRWNMEFEADFHENVADKFDVGWGQSHVQGRGRGYSPFPDRLYENSDLDEFYSYERSRYPARQPRVLPPPAISTVHRTPFRSESDCLGSSSYEDALQGESTVGNYQNTHEENSDIIVVQEQRVTNEEQELNNQNALGCDSQSSLSVSSPPSSPNQLSHDDFDESKDPLAVTGATESRDISLLESEADILEGEGNRVTTTSSTSVGDDEGWTVENIEVSQHQDDCDEDVGYHAEDDVHEGECENSELTQKFEEMYLEDKGSSDMIDNLVLGFDQGVEVGIPSDDHEKTARDDDGLYVGTQGTIGVIKPNESFDGLTDRQSPSPQITESSGAMAVETEKADHVSEPNNPSAGDSSSSSGLKAESQGSNQAVASVGGVLGSTELPKLQFGLFTGPSLIPSPVPSIQIGSIQMPLQLPPHIGPPLPQMHPSQPTTLFQFGQLRYLSPISQGILSLASQPVSCVQPNVPHNFPSSQAPNGPLNTQDSSSVGSVKHNGSRLTTNTQPIPPSNQFNVAKETELKEANSLAPPSAGSNTVRPQLGRRTNNFTRNSKPFVKNRVSETRPQGRSASFGPASDARNAAHQFPTNRGRRFGYSSRNSDARLTSPANESVRSDGNEFHRRPWRVTQRYEFRVRQNVDGKQSGLENQTNYDAKVYETRPRGGLYKETNSVIEEDKPSGEHALAGKPEGSLKRGISSADDIDAPLQSGVVRVFQQPGIEAPSDEDDFIEVRSKRQMLNDRREQREKEIKAKSSNMRKVQRISRPPFQESSVARNTNRNSAVTSKRGLPNNAVSAALDNIASQPLPPVGTSKLSSDSQTISKSLTVKPVQTGSFTVTERTVCADNLDLNSNGARKVGKVQSTLGSHGGPCTNQSVMTLTQTQLEDAMKPACFDTNITSIGNHSSSVSEPIVLPSPVPKTSSFSSAATINSLLAGEKIQFGAVMSPSTLPSLDIRTSQSMSSSKNNRDNLAEKENHMNKSSRSLEHREADAESTASAIAVAAIVKDEVIGNGIASAATDGISSGISVNQHTASQSKAEESLTVSLPADLSVETPPISIWPPLPSPHRSTQMLSPFQGGPTSHFPFYDLNPMMGGPVFAFEPTDESTGSPSQPQKSIPPSSGPLGTWQQCLTGVDTLYGPAGFPAPFINPPPGSIPGVQGPPHMVVYNHFASVGQFGQGGLSYMGTTYVPSGKQPDWKHTPTSTAMNSGEGEINNVNMVPHLAPGSPLLSMPSPMAMYEGPPFQSAPDMSIHPRWSHVQASPVHTIPQSMPLQQQTPVTLPAQFDHGSSDHPSSTTNKFSQTQTSTTQFATEHGPNDSTGVNSGSKGRFEDSGRNEPVITGASVSASQKAQSVHQKNTSGQQQQNYSQFQRGGQRNGSGADWSNRKTGFRGRNYPSGGERNFPPTKVKQIYVAKQSTTGKSTDV